MKTKLILTGITLFIGIFAILGFTNLKKSSPVIKEENITYSVGDKTFKGYVAYNPNIKGKRPGVIVVHEWWGLNDYPKMRARKLAELGYIALAVDIFGDGKTAANPNEAMALTGPFYKDPNLGESRLEAAIEKLKTFPEADAKNIAAIGYCFGGAMVLNAAKLGADLKGVVSFHGGLSTGIPVDKSKTKTKILICYGGSDKFVSLKDADAFKHQLDSAGIKYIFKSYPNATHAFTNPDATKAGKEFNLPIAYNAEADKNSWNDMKTFFGTIFKK